MRRRYSLGYRRGQATSLQRFFAKVKIAPGGCWEWQDSLRDGYGRFNIGCRRVSAHRFAYETFVGPIPDGLEPDHLCRNRSCVNPFHLEPVTRSVNMKRGDAGLATALRERAKTHCPGGHPYDAVNTYVDRKGWRKCRPCRRQQAKAIWRNPARRANALERQRRYRAKEVAA